MGRQEGLPKLQAMVHGDTGNSRVSVSAERVVPLPHPRGFPSG